MSLKDRVSLSGKKAIVCGASQGIGAATAKELASLGARVILVARSEDKLDHVFHALEGEGHKVLALDLLDTRELKKKVQALLEEMGQIEIVVNNAGGPKAGPIAEAEAEEFLAGLKLHVVAASTIAQLVLPGMKEKKYGRFINVISTSVKIPIPNLGVSNTIRGAMANWSKSLANEVGSFGITVNNVLPGFTETPRLEALKKAASERMQLKISEVEDMWRGQIPARRFAKPQETAEAIAFLSSPAASYINGINLPVDGGRTGCL